ncbi:MAG TPA: DUF3604 domain-containing protein [Candidatus Binatia bacterium]
MAAGCGGKSHGPGKIHGEAIPQQVIAAREAAGAKAAAQVAAVLGVKVPDKQILFGDLHVHSTWSSDAYVMSLPLMQGEGTHPVADACDFARYCSALDFWSITDHAETLTPQRWRDTIDSIRKCNAVSGTSHDQDLVSYLGWEWTQIGLTADEHYGHRNVILRDLDDDKIPARPVAAAGFSGQAMRDKLPLSVRWLLPLADWRYRSRYEDFLAYWSDTRDVDSCPDDVDVKDVHEDCMDYAKTPAELFAKLRQWGSVATVIPHGTSWGMYTPPGYYIDRSLRGTENDEGFEKLIEIDSGHGNAEQYRTWREASVDPEGHLVCPEPSAGYEPCCWRAGEIIRARCENPDSAECRGRVEDARRNYLAAGASGRLTISGADVADWGGCGQCLDCFDPPFEHRPGGSVQYALALSDFTDPDRLRRFQFGFVASSDDHTARPGTGYKEFHRQQMTEAFGPRSDFWHDWVRPLGEPRPKSEAIDPKVNRFQRFQILDYERGSSFFYTGGLVAVHAEGRNRQSIWDALQRREVYATSGERILLWFDLVRGANSVAPMGASVAWSGTPHFRVRAVGSFEQKPGCPDYAATGLGADRIESLCGGECYNPGERRHVIRRLEIVRIRPQVRPGEPIAGLIEDPWKTIPCSGESSGCVGEFADDDFGPGSRDALYYVRAIQEPTPAINAAGLRCKAGDKGPCTSVNPCYGDWRTPFDDDCLAPSEERAWSSPIYLAWKAGTADSRSSSSR